MHTTTTRAAVPLRFARTLRPWQSTCAATALLVCLVLCFASAAVRADERILDYASDITIAADGSMQVTETIRVRAESY